MLFPFPFKWTPESKSGEDTLLWSEEGPGEPEGGSRAILHNHILNNHRDARLSASRRACGYFTAPKTSHVGHKSRINIVVTTLWSSLNSSGPLLLVVRVVIKQKMAARENLCFFVLQANNKARLSGQTACGESQAPPHQRPAMNVNIPTRSELHTCISEGVSYKYSSNSSNYFPMFVFTP